MINFARLLNIYIMLALISWFSTQRMRSDAIPDGLIWGHCVWAVLAITYNHGFAKGIESGGVYSLEFLAPYFVGRFVGHSVRRVHLFVRIMYTCLLVFMPLVYFELFTGVNLVDQALAKVGYEGVIKEQDSRFGLFRASASFAHQILYGVFVASLFGIVIYVLRGNIALKALVVLLALIPSISSAAFLSYAFQLGLIFWDRAYWLGKEKWKILGVSVLLTYIAIEILSDRDAISAVMGYITFNPHTGYWRQLIWEYGSAEVARNWFLGIGFGDWQRPSFMYSGSVDNFWLLTAMRFGIPAILSLAGVYIIIFRRMRRSFGRIEKLRRNYLKGWCFTMAGMFLAGMTVHFWANSLVIFSMLLGIGVSMSKWRGKPVDIAGVGSK